MRVVICWSNISGYMAACWRELARQTDVELTVLAFGQDRDDPNAPFDQESVMRGVPWRPLSGAEQADEDAVGRIVDDLRPDVVVVCGWFVPSYVALTRRASLTNVRFILTADTPWRGDVRQHLARFKMRKFLKRFEAIFVPGERGFQYAKRLGFRENQINRGLYGIDYTGISKAADMRVKDPWPRKLLYVGRYDRVKGIDVLVEGYRAYRQSVEDPWSLTCCGRGPEGHLLKGVEGIEDRGFVQPSEQVALFAEHGAFVLCSRYDPWPLVIVETCAAGLPVIASESCGSAVEHVRSHYNGFFTATDDPESLQAAIRSIHRCDSASLAKMGGRSQSYAGAYSAEMWTQRLMQVLAQNDEATSSFASNR